jgi:hypothetical protein
MRKDLLQKRERKQLQQKQQKQKGKETRIHTAQKIDLKERMTIL